MLGKGQPAMTLWLDIYDLFCALGAENPMLTNSTTKIVLYILFINNISPQVGYKYSTHVQKMLIKVVKNCRFN